MAASHKWRPAVARTFLYGIYCENVKHESLAKAEQDDATHNKTTSAMWAW